MKKNNLETKLSRIEEILKIQNEEPLSFEQACSYLKFKRGYLYKLTFLKKIPHYKPLGKRIFFKKSELNEWLFRNRINTDDELQVEAEAYCRKAS